MRLAAILIGIALAAAVLSLFVWAATEGKLDCPEGQHSEIIGYTSVTSGKPPVKTTVPITACRKN